MKYYFRYFIQFSNFFNMVLKQESNIYFQASYLFNFKETCHNLILKKNFNYFIDPETYKFQFGGNKLFHIKYLTYFEEIKELFNQNNQLKIDLLNNSDNFNDLYKIIIRFQKKTLAYSHIPLDYYMSIVNEKNQEISFNPCENLLFTIAPYFEFSQINDIYYNHTLNYSKIKFDNYVLLRFRKNLLNNSSNIKRIYEDFKKNSGIILNVVELDQYNKNDLLQFFPNLIDLIYLFSLNNQKVILINNSEFGKYFKYFGLNSVCSNVMIGQRTRLFEPFQTNRKGGSTNLVYIPQIERSVSFSKGETLIARNPKIARIFPKSISNSKLEERVELYYENVQEKIVKINQMSFKAIKREILKSYNKISNKLHRNRYNYITRWVQILENKFTDIFA